MIASIARFRCREACLRSGEKNAARRLRMVVLSLAVHAGVLACVVWIGLVTRSRVVEHVDIGTLAGVEVAGGAHAVEIALPARLTAADTNKPERYADAAVPPTLDDEAVATAKRCRGRGACYASRGRRARQCGEWKWEQR